MNKFNDLVQDSMWQVAGRIVKLVFKDNDNVYFDDGLCLSKRQVELGNYIECRII